MKPALHVTETRKKKQKCTGIPYKTPVWPISTYKSCRKFDRHQRCKRNVHVHYITDQILTKIESFLSLYGLICGFQQRRNGQYRCYGQYQEPLTPCYMLQSILPSLKLFKKKSKVLLLQSSFNKHPHASNFEMKAIVGKHKNNDGIPTFFTCTKLFALHISWKSMYLKLSKFLPSRHTAVDTLQSTTNDYPA